MLVQPELRERLRNVDVVIIGAGAAGMMCASKAAYRGRRVLVVEKASKPGKKILISGGGRCNFTNMYASPAQYISANPHFCVSALKRYTPQDFIDLVEQYCIAYHEKKLGQLFCDSSARDIVAMLVEEMKRSGAELFCNADVHSVTKREDGLFEVRTEQGVICAESVVVAAGGPSIPAMGATETGYSIARSFGLAIVEPKPALVPLVFADAERAVFSQLSGLSIDAEVSCDGASFRENILFTHKGVSGPAILQISSYWDKGKSIEINCFPSVAMRDVFAAEHSSKMEVKNVLAQFVPKRFCDVFCEEVLGGSKPMNRYSHKELDALAYLCSAWSVVPKGTEGFAKAEVTRGGVDTTQLSSKTMECRDVQGLYFIGETVDVTGWLGGYNFQWAWASAVAAGAVV